MKDRPIYVLKYGEETEESVSISVAASSVIHLMTPCRSAAAYVFLLALAMTAYRAQTGNKSRSRRAVDDLSS